MRPVILGNAKDPGRYLLHCHPGLRAGATLRSSCYIAHGSLLAAHRRFVYSIEMARARTYIFLLSLFLLAACNEEKDFMTPKTGEVVLDINAEEFSLNGKVLGKTTTDISNSKNLLIKPLNDELQKIRMLEAKEATKKGIPVDEVKARLHIDENLPYDVFYKVAATLGFGGFSSIQYVIGPNFKEPLAIDMPERRKSPFLEEGVTPFRCNLAKNRRVLDELLEKTSHKKISTDEIMDRRIKDTELLIECARRYIDLSLTLRSNEDFPYVVSLNETGLIDGSKFYTYQNLDDVWKFIEDIRLRRELQDKEDRDLIVVVLENDMLVKKLLSVVNKLKSFGYKVHLAILSG